jgi:hypothetical protein
MALFQGNCDNQKEADDINHFADVLNISQSAQVSLRQGSHWCTRYLGQQT